MNPTMCSKVSLDWNMSLASTSASAYYDPNNIFLFAEVAPTKLRFMIRDYVPDKTGMRYVDLHATRFPDKQCVQTGTCTLLDIPEVHVRVVTCTVTATDQGNRWCPVEMYFFDRPGGKIIAQIFFYLVFGVAEIDHETCIVESDALTILDSVHEVLTCQRHNAAWRIQSAYLKAKYNPAYFMCQKMLVKDVEEIYSNLIYS